MNGNGISSEKVISKLIEMGFEKANVIEAVKVVGPSVDDAVEYILNGCCRNSHRTRSNSTSSANNVKKDLGRKASSSSCPLHQKRQSSTVEHFQSAGRTKRSAIMVVEQSKPPPSDESHCIKTTTSEEFPVDCSDELDIGPDWEDKVNNLLKKHFGHSGLKNFQKEALTAWLAHEDCLVLAATGSGTIYVCVCFCFLY